MVAWVWTRAAAQYRTSLVVLSVVSVIWAALEFAAVAIVFTAIDRLAGFSLAEVAFLYGTAATSLAIANLLLGNLERVGLRVRDGSLDAMLVRPISPLVQLAANDFQIRRFGRVAQAAVVLVIAITAIDVQWTPDRVLLIPAMVLAGAVIFGSIFVLGGAFQIMANDAAEVMNAFTYGGQQMTQYPLAVYGRDVLRIVTFLIPLAFINWYPALRILSHPDPLGLPTVLQFAAPLVAVLFAGVAAVAWRAGLSRYTSTGS